MKRADKEIDMTHKSDEAVEVLLADLVMAHGAILEIVQCAREMVEEVAGTVSR